MFYSLFLWASLFCTFVLFLCLRFWTFYFRILVFKFVNVFAICFISHKHTDMFVLACISVLFLINTLSPSFSFNLFSFNLVSRVKPWCFVFNLIPILRICVAYFYEVCLQSASILVRMYLSIYYYLLCNIMFTHHILVRAGGKLKIGIISNQV